MRSAQLIRAGTSETALRAAVARGALVRLRRVWVAVPDADARLAFAAREGCVLTCVTAAAHLGLWTFDAPLPHLAVPAHAGRVRVTGAVIHRARPLIPRHPDLLVDEIENVLILTAQCQPFEKALVVWESAFRRRLADRTVIGRLQLSKAAAAVWDAAAVTSDSGLETLVVPRLRWTNLPILPQAWIHGHCVDFLVGERLVLQIDGGTHVGQQRRSDIRHDAELTLRGYHVIRVGYDDVVNDWPHVQRLILRAIAQGLHRA